MVTTLAQKDMAYGKYAAREDGVAKFVPYTRHVDDHTVATRDGLLLQTLKVRGYSFETADIIDLNALKRIRETLLRSLADSRFALYHHIVRRDVSQYPDGAFDDPFCRALDRAYKARLDKSRMFVNEQYLTLVRRPQPGVVGGIAALIQSLNSSVDKQAKSDQEASDLKALNDGVQKIETTLARYGVKRLGIYEEDGAQYSHLLSFLGSLINQETMPIRLPRMPLGEYLPRKRIFFQNESFEIRGPAPGDVKRGGVISIRDYGNTTGAGILDNLLRLPHSFTLTQSFGFVERQIALTKMKRLQRQVRSAEEQARSLDADLDDAIDELTAGFSAFGEHHLTVTATGQTSSEVDQAISKIDGELTRFGIIGVREDLNLEPAYWAQLPGNFAMIARKSMISTKNLSGFSSLHTFPSGNFHGTGTWGEPVSLLETTSGSPYWFSFHDERGVGNFTLVGPTGSGKTVLLAFLTAQAQRLHADTIFFDKDRGAEIFIRAIGGEYLRLKPGEPTGLNPLQLNDTPANRAWLAEWISGLATIGTNENLSPSEIRIISDAVDANFEEPLEHRRLSVLAELFRGFEIQSDTSLSARLARWHGNGDRAWLFDNAVDRLSFNNSTIAFDTTQILDDPISRTPWLSYIFHRIDDQLDGRRLMIMMDEGWKLLDDPVFAYRIKDLEKTIRKRNGLIGFATQSPQDIAKSSVGDAIIEQSATNIFLPNPHADEETYVKGFGLSQHELKLIREMDPTSRLFLLRHANDSVVARLDLSGMDEFIAVLSGNSNTVADVETLRDAHGDDPRAWLPQFMERFQT